MSEVKKKEEDWMTSKWRPMMAMVYMAINVFDFIVMPVFYNLLQFWTQGQHISAYQALTLQGGGLIHIAFGAILGISAYTRGQEKVEAIRNAPALAPISPKPISKVEEYVA